MLNNKLIRLIGIGIVTMTLAATPLTTTASTTHNDKGNELFRIPPNSIGLVQDNRQTIYMADPETGDIYSIPIGTPPIRLARIPGTPTALAVDCMRRVFVSTTDCVIYRVQLDGTITKIGKCPARPTGLSIDRDGRIIVASEDGIVWEIQPNIKD